MSALAIVAYLFSIIAIAILAIKARELVGIFKKGQPDPTRSSNRGARLRNMLKEVLGHTKMLRFTGTGIAHWFVMVGFGALLGTLITAFGQVIDPHFYIPGVGQFTPYLWIVEAIAWLTGIGIVTLIGIRQVTRIRNRGRASRFYGSGSWKAYYVEATILAIVFCVIALRGLEGALEGVTGWNAKYPLTSFVVQFFNGQAESSIENLIIVVAFIKILVSMTWFVVIALNLTMGIAWHRFLAFFNI